ncbi:hypothetical protein AWENTII_010291 [Aspergillus wentii]
MAWYDFKRPISAQQDVSDERDKAYLERLGKRSVLQRNFGIWSILGFSCTILSTWEGLFATFLIPLQKPSRRRLCVYLCLDGNGCFVYCSGGDVFYVCLSLSL